MLDFESQETLNIIELSIEPDELVRMILFQILSQESNVGSGCCAIHFESFPLKVGQAVSFSLRNFPHITHPFCDKTNTLAGD